ncbi:MAG TPA: hypothetical protein PKI03_14365 [Pseudomonadota bacterium]|nr:hypothetical protein [Pseudomonadota bacterium]
MPTLREHMSAKKVLQELNAAARDAAQADSPSVDPVGAGAGQAAESTEPGLRGKGVPKLGSASSEAGARANRAAAVGRDEGLADPTMVDATSLDAIAGSAGPLSTGQLAVMESLASGEQTAIRPAKEMPTATLVIEAAEPSAQVEAPSRRSLGNDATQFVPVPEGGEGDSGPNEAKSRPAPAPAQSAPPGGAKTQPLATIRPSRPAGQDATLVHEHKPPTRPDSTLVMRDEPSLGVQRTQLMEIPADETAVKPLFAQGQDRKKSSADSPRNLEPPTLPGNMGRGRARLWAGLCLGLLIGGSGWAAGSWLLERQRVAELATQSRAAIADAQRHGRIADYVAAEAMLSRLLVKRTTDGAAMSARALVLSEAQYELGGVAKFEGGGESAAGASPEAKPAASPGSPPSAEKTGTADGSKGGSEPSTSAWATAAQAAARQAEGETTAVAYSAQVLAALSAGDLKAAERALERLQALAPSADQESELVALPPGWRAYLASQTAFLAGRDEEAQTLLSDALSKSQLPLWRRHLAELLFQRGRYDEGLAQLSMAEKDQPDLCGVQIDLTWAKARRAGTAAQRQGLAELTEFSAPPRSGADPCGRGERARAALLSAELTLDSDPAARGDARAALARARAMTAPEDVLAGDRLAAAWLRTGDPRLAEVQSRSGLSHLATRRRTRLLLAESLLRLNQGAEALTTLEPLLAGSAGIEDSEAALLKARVLLSLNDTLEAQKLARKLVASTGVAPQVRAGAQRVLGRVSLILGEPATARRTLEPLVRQLAGANATDSQLRDEQLDTQILWAEVLLSVRPAEQNEARAILEAVVTRAPERIEARLLLGRLLREIQEWGQAEQQLSAALRTDERHTGARRELAGLLMQRGDYAKAHALYRELVKEEQDADLLIASARAERLDGAAEPSLATLGTVKRGRGEVTGKYDEVLLIEKARTLLALDRCSEVQNLLRPLLPDISQLKRPALPALLIRAQLCSALPGERAAAAAQGRGLLMRLPPAWRADVDVRLAECELLAATGNFLAARLGLTALVATLQTIPPTSVGEEAALRQYCQKMLERLPGGPVLAPAAPAAPTPPR